MRKKTYRRNPAATPRDTYHEESYSLGTFYVVEQGIHQIHSAHPMHWETIRNLHINLMESILQEHHNRLKLADYHLKYLVLDEFAIHKWHTYAKGVMDLEAGEVIWIDKGRSKEDFRNLFDEIEPAFLVNIKAVAMGRNIFYNILVKE